MHPRFTAFLLLAFLSSSSFSTLALQVNPNMKSQPSKALTDFTALSAGWSGKATITGLYGLDGDRVLIKLSNFANPHDCNTNSSGDIMLNTKTHPAWFSMALTAYTTGKPVNVYVRPECEAYWSGTSFAVPGHFKLL